MRVLLVDYSVGFGGATKSIGLVLRQLPEVEFHVYTCQDSVQCKLWYNTLPVVRFRQRVNYVTLGQTRRVAERVLGIVGLKLVALGDRCVSIISFFRLLRHVRRARIDVIHLNNGATPEEVLWVARVLQLPLVVFLRGIPDVPPGRLPLPRRRRLVAVSPSVLKAHAGMEVDATETSVIWDPVDLELFDRSAHQRDPIRRAMGVGDEEIAVGIFGRLIRLKGQLEFARVALRLLADGHDIRPVIVGGDGDFGDGYIGEIRALVTASAYADRFVFVGYQTEPAGYFHAMDIVVHFSVEPEGLGMVIPEAMAAGKPVVAARSGGPADIIEHDVDGLLVPYRDEEALYLALRSLIEAPYDRDRISRAAGTKAHREFSIGSAAERTRAVYAELVEGS